MRKLFLTIALVCGISSPAIANEYPIASRGGDSSEIHQATYTNPIDKEIALATYEFTDISEAQAFERLERVLPQADPGRTLQIESQLFLNYLHFSNLVHPERSEQWLSRAAELRPADPRPHRRLRELYCLQSKLKACKKAHLDAVKRSSDEASELKALGDALSLAARYSDAVQVYAFAIEAEGEKSAPSSEFIKRLKYKINKLKTLR